MNDATIHELARIAQRKTIQARRRKPRPKRSKGLESADRAYSPAQRAGRDAEDRAGRYLEDHGLSILARNLSCRTGEIDLVAAEASVLVFIEVRQRRSRQFGGAAASVNRNKQARLIRSAELLLPSLTQRFFQGRIPACRFDVISIEPSGLTWTRNAFAL